VDSGCKQFVEYKTNSWEPKEVNGCTAEILSFDEICLGVGFNKYWEREERYKYNENNWVSPIEKAINRYWAGRKKVFCREISIHWQIDGGSSLPCTS